MESRDNAVLLTEADALLLALGMASALVYGQQKNASFDERLEVVQCREPGLRAPCSLDMEHQRWGSQKV